MAITNSTLKSTYGGKTDGTDKFTAALWDNMLGAADTKLNAIIAALNGSSTTEDDFYVNGTKTTPTSGVIQLDAGRTYVLKGTLTGQIKIGTSTDEPSVDTTIELDGVTITTDSEDNAAILYNPEKQCLRVLLSKNSVNKLVCSNWADKDDSQKGCLWSENNMVIMGNGYLACKNEGGHGIKASELRLWGNPHIYVSAMHDGIHGNKEIDICGGVYYIATANDAFGTRAAEGTEGSDDYKSPGRILAFKGNIMAYNIVQNVLDSKAAGYIFGDVGVQTDASTPLSGMTKVDPQVFFGGATFTVGTAGYTTAATGSVKCYAAVDTDGNPTGTPITITATDGVYDLGSYKYCEISGYIDGKITTATQSSDIHAVGNTYVTGNIEYTATKKKLGISVEKDGVICVIAGNAVSAGNLAIEVKSGSLCSILGNIETGDFTFNDSKGVLMLAGNLTGDIIYVGTEEGGSTNVLEGAFIVDGTVTSTLSSKFKKGTIETVKAGLLGIFCADTLNVAVLSDMKQSTHVFYHNAIGTVIGTKTIENEDYVAC